MANKPQRRRLPKRKSALQPLPSKEMEAYKKDWKYYISLTWKLLSGVSVLLAFVGAYYDFSENVSVSADTSLNPKNALETRFKLTNNSQLPIHNVNHKSFIDSMRSATGRSGISNSVVELNDNLTLEPKESTNIIIFNPSTFPFPIGNITQADVVIEISYQTAFLGRFFGQTQHQTVRFEANPDVNGMVHWFHKAVNE